MELNFNTIDRPTLKLVLNDDEQTVLHLTSPIKKTADEYQAIFEDLIDNTKTLSMDDIFKCCSKLLSKNTEGITISIEKVKSIFSLDDVIILLSAYKDFLSRMYNQKN